MSIKGIDYISFEGTIKDIAEGKFLCASCNSYLNSSDYAECSDCRIQL